MTAKRFYRPELDALRFFAFLAVLMHHGPYGPGFLNFVCRACGFGLSMFFLLSAYLITELLLREREQSGTISWKLFFARRALRIWPLYYAALAAVMVASRIPPYETGISRSGIAVLSFFVANCFRSSAPLPHILVPLWSISVEEQFYLIWPPIVRVGGKKSAFLAAVLFVVSACVWLAVFSGKGWTLWYDTPVEFLFFATGVIVALATHGGPRHAMNGLVRGGLLTAGLLSLAIAASHIAGIGTDDVQGLTTARLYLGYTLANAGCALIFVAILGISKVPRTLTYLGKISYGLYVFHAGILGLSRWLAIPLKLAHPSALNMFVVDGIALLLTIPAAHLSYRYFEMPFLKLKERFAIVKSRPA
jgi:peptidoglycan/LPS O-acetylase OafA/YrhL